MRSGRTWLIAALFGAALPGAAAGAPNDREFLTGDGLYQRCEAPDADADAPVRRAACRGYILGVSDALQASQGLATNGSAPAICLADADADAVIGRVSAYLGSHPENRRFAAPDLIGAALREAYPCR
jgi:hypothetical protein